MKAWITLLLLVLPGSLWASDRFLAEPGGLGLFLVAPLLVLGLAGLVLAKNRYITSIPTRHGFSLITPGKKQRFFPIVESVESMEPVVKALGDEGINIYSNVAKITLSHKPQGLFLEEKNYKISILVNRRRSRRCFLNDGDILDMGELTLLYHSPHPYRENREDKEQAGHQIPRVKRVQGKPIKTYPSLIPADKRKKTFFLTQNLTFVGRSDMNDLVSKSKGMAPRHSKIEKVAGRYKIIDLDTQGGTFVNGRRVEQKFLKDGDHISFESVKYLFSLSGEPR